MAIMLQRLYSNALDLEYSGEFTGYSYEIAAERFEHLGDFRDAAAYAENCRRLAAQEKPDNDKIDIQRNLYLVACEMAMDGYDSEASEKFKLLSKGDYRNSRRHLKECQQRLKEARRHDEAPTFGASRPNHFWETDVRWDCPPLPDAPRSWSNEERRRAPAPIIRDIRPGPFWERLSRKVFYRSLGRDRSSRRMKEFCRLVNNAFLAGVLAGVGSSAAIGTALYFFVLH